MLLSRLNVLPLAGLFLTYPSVTLRQSRLTACLRQYSVASPCCLEFAKYIGTWNITNTKKSSKPSIGFLGQQQSRAFHIASAEELVRDNGLAARYVYVGSCPLAYCHLVFPLDWLRKKRTPIYVKLTVLLNLYNFPLKKALCRFRSCTMKIDVVTSCSCYQTSTSINLSKLSHEIC